MFTHLWQTEWRPVAVGLAAGCVLTLIAVFVGATFTGAGHGTRLPVLLFIAPGGAGLLAWPASYALMALPRKWLLAAIPLIAMCLTVHLVSAVGVYDTEIALRRQLVRVPHRMRSIIDAYYIVVALLELVPLFCVVVRLYLQRDRDSNLK